MTGDRHPGDRLAALVDGRLGEPERSAVLQHVASCSKCRTEYDSQRVMKGLLGGLAEPAAPTELHSRLSGLSAPQPPAPVVLPWWRGVVHPPRSGAQAVRVAAVGSVVVGALVVGGGYAAGGATASPAVVPAVGTYVREHSETAGDVPLSEPVLSRLTRGTVVQPTGSGPSPASVKAPIDTAAAGSSPSAQATLAKAVQAGQTLGYSGVEVLVDADADGTARRSVVDVGHIPGRGTVVSLRPDDGEVAASAFQADDDDVAADRAALLLQMLGSSFRLTVAPPTTMLGRQVTVVQALRADGRPAAMFWVDEKTGLLLRREVLDDAGRAASSFELVKLTFGVPRIAYLPPMLSQPTGTSLDLMDLEQYRDDGWPCPSSLAGLTLFDARLVTVAGGEALHLSYSDGLSTVSVFVEQGTLDTSVLAATTSAQVGHHDVREVTGAVRPLLWAAQGHVFTVVSDAPADTVDAVVAALPSGSDPDGAWDRVDRGISRMGSWVNPFG